MTVADLMGQRLAGRFQIHTDYGEGLLGRVLAATDEIRGVPVDVIELPGAFAVNANRRAELLAEIDPLRKARHPAIRRVLTVVQVEQALFLVQEAAGGDTLRAEFGASRSGTSRIQALDVVTFARGLCDALLALHSRGLWHGTLCPELIAFANDGQIRLAGLGQAQCWYATPAAQAVLSPYSERDRAPWNSEDGSQADRFAVARILREALCGSATGTEPVSSQREDTPRWLAAAIERELSPRLDQRFTDTGRFRAAVIGERHDS